MQTTLSDIQLDAMRELANIGSGTAATALSRMIGMPVQLDVPTALALPVADAVEQAGDGDAVVTAVIIPTIGDLEALALIVMRDATVETICGLLGVESDTEVGASASCEIGNILGASYLGALAALTGLELQPGVPERVVDMLGAILTTALMASGDGDTALWLESKLSVDGHECSPTFLFIPSESGLDGLLSHLGVGS